MTHLNAFERDALQEILNIGIGRAADALSRMMGEEILLAIPQVSLVSLAQAAELLRQQGSNAVAGVRQPFSGPFKGSALLIYPEERSLELVRMLLKEETPLESLTALEREALVEVGNVILNACIGSIANLLEVEFQCALPHYLQGQGAEVLRQATDWGEDPKTPPDEERLLLLVVVSFVTEKSALNGYVVLMLDMEALDRLREEIQRVTGQIE